MSGEQPAAFAAFRGGGAGTGRDDEGGSGDEVQGEVGAAAGGVGDEPGGLQFGQSAAEAAPPEAEGDRQSGLRPAWGEHGASVVAEDDEDDEETSSDPGEVVLVAEVA